MQAETLATGRRGPCWLRQRGMFAKNVYRDDAVVAHARPDSLHGLVRVDPPHQFILVRLSVGLTMLVLAWLVMGTTDHSLWLHGVPAERWDAMTASPALDGKDGSRAELLALVSVRDAETLAPGMRVDVLSFRTMASREAVGTVLSISSHTGEIPSRIAETARLRPGRSLLVRIGVPERALRDERAAADGLHRLRIPLGRESPLRFLTRQLPQSIRGDW